jgi:hypothetical protein
MDGSISGLPSRKCLIPSPCASPQSVRGGSPSVATASNQAAGGVYAEAPIHRQASSASLAAQHHLEGDIQMTADATACVDSFGFDVHTNNNGTPKPIPDTAALALKGSKPVSFVVTDVEGSTKLWEWNPKVRHRNTWVAQLALQVLPANRAALTASLPTLCSSYEGCFCQLSGILMVPVWVPCPSCDQTHHFSVQFSGILCLVLCIPTVTRVCYILSAVRSVASMCAACSALSAYPAYHHPSCDTSLLRSLCPKSCSICFSNVHIPSYVLAPQTMPQQRLRAIQAAVCVR